MLCCVVLETSWITAVAGDEVLALPKCDVYRRQSIQKAATKN
jgi:hypothetical protein